MERLSAHRQAEIDLLLSRQVITPIQLEDPKFSRALNYDLDVSDHETGHRIGTYGVGGTFLKATIIPKAGSYAGATWSLTNPNKPIEDQYFDRMVIAAAGESAEIYTGHDDHRGAGSDRGTTRFLARVLEFWSGGRVSAEKYYSASRQRANQIISNYGLGALRERSIDLYMKKVLA